MKALCLYGSPKKGGNTDILLDELCEGIEEGGGKIEKVYLRRLLIYPCDSCSLCYKEGKCHIRDDMDFLHAKFFESDLICLGAPVYFLSLPSIVKTMIERCEIYWVKKNFFRESLKNKKGKGILILLSGSKDKNASYCSEKIARTFFNTIDYEFASSWVFSGIDEKKKGVKEDKKLKELKEWAREYTKKGGTNESKY